MVHISLVNRVMHFCVTPYWFDVSHCDQFVDCSSIRKQTSLGILLISLAKAFSLYLFVSFFRVDKFTVYVRTKCLLATRAL